MQVSALANAIKGNVARVITGKEQQLELVCAVLLAGGNLLLEDVPGTGKTRLAKALAASLGVSFKRIQFTPDLLPGDLIGINYYNPKLGDFVFRQGAIFTGILLADEINRATPRTQSALLEAMEEKQVTVDGTCYSLDRPFFVIATQNPIEAQGTYPLPEAQLDRFMARMSLGYPTPEECLTIINTHCGSSPEPQPEAVCTGEQLLTAMEECSKTYIHPDLCSYIVTLCQGTRSLPGVVLGVSTRGMLNTVRLAKALAAVRGRAFVTPEDVKYVFPYVCGHRLILSTGAMLNQGRVKELIEGLLATTPVPQEDWDK